MQAADTHLCARVRVLTGALAVDLADGEACLATRPLAMAETEADCGRDHPRVPALLSPTHLAIVDVESDAPYPGFSLGWYASCGGQVVRSAVGFAWNDDLEGAGVAAQSSVEAGWTPGERYVLWPVCAWEV